MGSTWPQCWGDLGTKIAGKSLEKKGIACGSRPCIQYALPNCTTPASFFVSYKWPFSSGKSPPRNNEMNFKVLVRQLVFVLAYGILTPLSSLAHVPTNDSPHAT